MMNKILNWVFGSFFRTIGRLLVFILLGFIIANLVDFGTLIDNFRITDLFFEKVNADTFQPGSWTGGIVYYKDSSLTTQYDILPNSGATTYYSTVSTSTSNLTWYTSTNFYFNNSFNLSNYGGGHLDFQLNVSLPIIKNNVNNVISTSYCSSWSPESSSGNTAYSCSSTTNRTSTILDSEYITPKTSFKAILYYGSGYSDCVFNSSTNTISCPLVGWATSVNRLTIQSYVYFSSSNSYDYYIELGKVPSLYVPDSKIVSDKIDETNDAINSQTQQQQQQHEELMDTNTTEANTEGEDFINNFSTESHGLTGIITAPLTAIQSVASATCSSLVLPLPFVDESLTLPCMSTIYSEYFGSFYTIYQGIILALISYWVCVRIFSLVKGFKDPEDDKIEVMDL